MRRRVLATRKPAPSISRTPVMAADPCTRLSLDLLGGRVVDARETRIEAVPAARFVHAARAHEDAVAARDQALRVIGGIAADDADGQRLGDVLSDGEQLRHRLERPAEIIL